MVELKDVVDEVIPLEDILFPSDKSKCAHVALDDTFVPIKDEDRVIGCIMKCANCGTPIECRCPCAVGALELVDIENGHPPIVMHTCNLQENQRFLKDLKKYWDWAEHIPSI